MSSNRPRRPATEATELMDMDVLLAQARGPSTLSKIGRGIKTAGAVLIATIIATARLMLNAGSSFFIMPKFLKNLPKFIPALGSVENHPLGFYITIYLIISGTIVNGATRAFKVFRHFLEGNDQKPNNLAVNTIQTEQGQIAKPRDVVPLGVVGSTLNISLRGLNITSGAFITLAAFLNAMSLIEEIAKRANINPHDEQHEITTESAALVLALLALLTYYVFNMKTAAHNIRLTAHNLEARNFAWDTATKKTLAWAFLGSMTVPFTSYFAAEHGLMKFPHGRVPNDVKYALASLSAISGVVSHLMTQVPALYESFKEHEHAKLPQCWVPPTTFVVGAAGFGDAIGTTITNFTSVMLTLNQMFDVSLDNPTALVMGALFSLSYAKLNYVFQLEGYRSNLEHALAVPETNDIEAPHTEEIIVHDTPTTGTASAAINIYGKNATGNTALLFNSATTPASARKNDAFEIAITSYEFSHP